MVGQADCTTSPEGNIIMLLQRARLCAGAVGVLLSVAATPLLTSVPASALSGPGALPAAVATAEPADALTEALRFRASMGLRTDPAYVQQLLAAAASSPTRYNDTYGTPLRAEEAQEIDERQKTIEEDAPKVRSYIAERGQPELLGGLFMDNANDGTLTVAVTEDGARVNRELRQRVRHPERLIVVQVARSLRALEEGSARLFAERTQTPNSFTVTSTSVDEPTNRINVNVSGDVEAARAFYSASDGDTVIVQEASITPVGTKAANSPPFRGGQSILCSEGYGCSTGFVAYNINNSIRHYVLTAAHCGRVGNTWAQVGFPVGTVDASQTRGTDVQRIPILSTFKSNQITINYSSFLGQGSYRSVTSSQAASDDVVGETECFTGQNITNIQCGALKTKTFSGSFPTYYGATVDYLGKGREADFDCNPGDSGGPAFTGNQARGIISAKITRVLNDTCVYAHIDDAMTAVGILEVQTS